MFTGAIRTDNGREDTALIPQVDDAVVLLIGLYS